MPDSLQVQDAKAQAEADAKETNEGMAFIRYFFLGFGAIALFVGSFVIFNTLSITVAQRTREFATLRTLGASRKQVMRSVVLEGLVIGFVASVIGLLAGLGIYKGLNALFVAIGADLPKSGTVIAHADDHRLAADRHDRDAAREHPARAARHAGAADRGGPRGRRAARRPGSPSHSAKLAYGVVAASVAAISRRRVRRRRRHARRRRPARRRRDRAVRRRRLAAPRLVEPLARLVGWPGRRTGGVAGELASANAVRNPSRTASTAAALMIGLTLVTVVAVLGAGLRSSVEGAVTDQVEAAVHPRPRRRALLRRRRGRRAREGRRRRGGLARADGHRARRRARSPT